MELDDLKPNWQKSSHAIKSKTEIQKMMQLKNHPKLNRVRIKIITETAFLIAFLLICNTIFDGENKPVWVNVILLSSTVLFILNNIGGYLVLLNPVRGNNLAQSVSCFHWKIKKLSVLSLVTAFLFGASVILFFTSTITFTPEKYFLLAGMTTSLFIGIYFSWKNWTYRIKQITRTALEFEKGQ